jgi:hypothetical protein
MEILSKSLIEIEFSSSGTWVAQEFASFLKRSIDSYLMIAMLLLLSTGFAGKTIKSIQEFFK